MELRHLGRTGPLVSEIGLGAMGMSGMYGPADRAESIATIHAALDAGINLLDTGDFYGMGHNEPLIREALESRDRDDVVISVKFGAQRDPSAAWLGYDASPPAVKTALAYSLVRLGTDHIDVYRPARHDHDHDHDHGSELTQTQRRVRALESILVEKGYVDPVALDELVDTYE